MGNLRFSEISGKILSSMKRLENQTIFDFAVKDFLTKGILARKTTPSEAEWEAQGKSAVWLKGQPGTSQARRRGCRLMAKMYQRAQFGGSGRQAFRVSNGSKRKSG
jgi:hypothetical protein